MCKGTLRRKKSCLLVEDSAEELVCRAESLHQEIALAFADHTHSLLDRILLVFIVDDGECSHVHLFILAGLCNQVFVTYESDIRQAELYGLACSRHGVSVDTPCGNHSFPAASAAKLGIDLFKCGQHMKIIYSSSFWTIFMVSRAIISSSFVVMRATFTLESGSVMIVSTPLTTLAS